MKGFQHINALFLVLVAMCFASKDLQAAEKQMSKTVRLRSFSMLDGLPSNSIAMMTAGHDGLLWIATWNGLCNYDGYRFNSFTTSAYNKQVLNSNRLSRAIPADNGDVWITTFDNRLFLLDAKERKYIDGQEKLSALGYNDFRVQYMRMQDDGTIWICGHNGEKTTVNLMVSGGKIEECKQPALPDKNNKFQDTKGRQWSIEADGTITQREDKSVRNLSCTFPDDWPRITIEQSLTLEDLNGTVWLLPNGKTVCYYDENSKSLVPINLRSADNSLPDEVEIARVCVDRQKNLWFFNRFNLCALSFCDYKFQYVPVIANGETRAMFIDSKSRLWVGTKTGRIAIFNPDKTTAVFLSANGNLSQSEVAFSSQGIYAIHEDRHGRLWTGTRGNGVYLLTPRANGYTVQQFTEQNSTICGNHIYDIQEDATGRVWFATYKNGVMYLDERNDNIHFISAVNCNSLKLPEGNIRKVRRIENATDGTLIFSTSEGIVTLNPHFNHPEEIVLHISSHSPGSQSLLAPDVLQTLICKRSKQNFVATMGGGIQSIQADNLQKSPLTFSSVEHNFNNIGNIRGMVEDLQGRIWIIGENAIHSLASDGNHQRTYSANDWGRNIEFSEAKPICDPTTGNVIVGAQGGIIIFSPETLKNTSFTPSVVFTGIQYQGDESITPLIGNSEITLPVSRHNAVVYFSALDYEDNSQIRYAYRICELDEQWSFVGSEHNASLSNLPPGHYTLEVRSTNSEGEWVSNNAELKIYVEPTFWQTTWAWLIYLLLGSLFIYGIVYLLWLRKAHRMEKHLKEQQLRFFTDISHQLRTPLTLIGGPATELLNTEHLSERGINLLKSIENNASKMLKLVNKSLDLKKLTKITEELASGGNTLPLDIYEDTDISSAEENLDKSDLTILIVEDNDELRYFLKTSLATHYNIIEAENGKIGLKCAAEQQPDFIITDIMMPEMDGITMLRRIKSNETISHIPIIILSARTADVYRIEGLKEGADDYITKPFSISYLQVRVESIVRQRRMLQEEWRKSLISPETTVAEETQMPANEPSVLSLLDQNFTTALTEYINNHLHDPNLRIDDIALAMHMSRSVLYGKIKAIYGISPNDVVRNLRMTKACAILREDFTKNVAEVAFAVGYTDAKNFTRNFKQIIGQTPTEYKKDC